MFQKQKVLFIWVQYLYTGTPRYGKATNSYDARY